MKRIKKMLGMMLALIMVLAMSVTAFAAEDSHDYELYQIFIGDVSKNSAGKEIFSNVKWGKNGIDYKEDSAENNAVSEEILNELKNVESKSDSEKLDVIKNYVNLDKEKAYSKTENLEPNKDDEGNVTYSNLPAGYYLIKDSKPITGNDVYTTYVVQVTDGTLTFKRKGNVPEVDKKIVEGNDEVENNEASIGDTIAFKITGTLPSNFADYKEYTYIFTDTLSKGLDYINSDTKVFIVNGTDEDDVTKYFYINESKDETTGVTTLKVGISDLKALGNLTPAVTVNKDSKIVVTYNARLNENAVIAGDGNDNKVKLAYSNDPNNSGEGSTAPPPENPGEPTPPKGETPEQKTTTYTTGLTILKHNEKHEILTGAEFTLTGTGVNVTVITGEVYEEDENGAYWKLKNGTYTTTAPTIGGDGDNQSAYDDVNKKYSKKTEATVVNGDGTPNRSVSAYVNSEGKVTFSGLGAGIYTITETVTPAGYNTIAPIEFTITFRYDSDKEKAEFSSDNEDVTVGTDNMLDTTIINKSGTTLPSTGGMGTTIFYVLGAILVVGAGVLLVVRRRMDREK